RFHINEGHAALLPLELLEEETRRTGSATPSPAVIERVRSMCVFTTHTPVPAGHDHFPIELAMKVLGEWQSVKLQEIVYHEGHLNMSRLAFNMSRYVNGVAKRHAEVSRQMFQSDEIDAITNGVHATTWVSDPMQDLFDTYMPDWREDNFTLRNA